MRKLLPLCLPHEDAAYNLQNLAIFLAGFVTGEAWAISLGCGDRLHQSYRAAAMPGTNDVLSLIGHQGLLSASIAGSGPAMLLLHSPDQPEGCDEALAIFKRHDPGARIECVSVSLGGYEICRHSDSSPIFPLHG